jgi:hypothetical protein
MEKRAGPNFSNRGICAGIFNEERAGSNNAKRGGISLVKTLIITTPKTPLSDNTPKTA